MEHLTPLAAIYRAVMEEPPKEMPVANFVFGFKYPTPIISSLGGQPLETWVEWENKRGCLVVSTACENIAFRTWDGFSRFLSILNREVLPYLSGITAGNLAATTAIHGPDLLAPAFRFTIACGKRRGEDIIPVFQKMLFDRAAFALWLTRTAFARLALASEPPSPAECRALIAREYGRFYLGLTDQEDITYKPGLYENCYGRGLDKMQ
jgi:hypothetical protein